MDRVGWSRDMSATIRHAGKETLAAKADFYLWPYLVGCWATTMQFADWQSYYDDEYVKLSPTMHYTFTDKIKVNLGAVRRLVR